MWIYRIAFLLSLGSCAGVKPYEKEFLLHPLMDEAALKSLTSDFHSVCVADVERLSASGSGSGVATSCPTCGG